MQAEEVQESKSVIQMRLSASKLDKKDLFGKVSSLDTGILYLAIAVITLLSTVLRGVVIMLQHDTKVRLANRCHHKVE